ncbi:MAG: FMN-binding protein [Desulfitobacteriaceae bacterium]|nr:FMN-binding protein [Desulfitobacteriaceae bacterium]MDD4345980.1 FMN-binding protein [Desulfitobacteriaceae bacterium]MDD4401011.1 FMN-binding protein [Desulfitobacteriaceae bacterium]
MEHSNKNDSILKIALNLLGACIISGIIIGSLYTATNDIAVAKQEELKTASLQSMVADADEYKEIEGKEEWFAAMKDGQAIAYIVPAESRGYAGAIELLVAVTPDHKVMKYIIVESKETPGLGDKAKEEPFVNQFIGKGADELDPDEAVTKTNEKGKIQSIAGSTITTRAVTKAVYEAVEAVAAFDKGGH